MKKWTRALYASLFLLVASASTIFSKELPLEKIVNQPEPQSTEIIDASEPSKTSFTFNTNIAETIYESSKKTNIDSGVAFSGFNHNLKDLDDDKLESSSFQESINSIYYKKSFADIGLNIDSATNIYKVLKGLNNPSNFMEIASENTKTNEDAIYRALTLMSQLANNTYSNSNVQPLGTYDIFKNLPQILSGNIIGEDYRFVCNNITLAGQEYIKQIAKRNNLELNSWTTGVNYKFALHSVLMIRDENIGKMYIGDVGKLLAINSIDPSDILSYYYKNTQNPIRIDMGYFHEQGRKVETETTKSAKSIMSIFDNSENSFGQNLITKQKLKENLSITLKGTEKEIQINYNGFNLTLGDINTSEVGYNNNMKHLSLGYEKNLEGKSLEGKISTLLVQNSTLENPALNILPVIYYSEDISLTHSLIARAGIQISAQIAKNLNLNHDSRIKSILTGKCFNSELGINILYSNKNLNAYSGIDLGNLMTTYVRSPIDDSEINWDGVKDLTKVILPIYLENIRAGVKYETDKSQIGLDTKIGTFGFEPVSIEGKIYGKLTPLDNFSTYASILGRKIIGDYNSSKFPDELKVQAGITYETGRFVFKIDGDYSQRAWCGGKFKEPAKTSVTASATAKIH